MELTEKEMCHKWHNTNGKSNAGLTLGIIGTALGAWNLFKGRGFSLGLGSDSMPTNVNINGSLPGFSSPSAFQVWEKESADAFVLQKEMCDYALLSQNQRFMDRGVINQELFGLYKLNQDGIKSTNERITNELFALYKESRDKDDMLKERLSALESAVAVNTAIRPYQDRLIQCDIDKAHDDAINFTKEKTCKAIYGQICLPNTPVITGYAGANSCGCIRTVAASTTNA